MKFKFTPRELRLLVLLLVLVILAGFYQFIYMPVTADRMIAQTVHKDVTTEESAILENILSKDTLREVIHSLQRESKILTRQLPPRIDQEYVVLDLISIFKENNTELLSFGFNGDEFTSKSNGVNSVDDALALYEESFNENNAKIDELKNMFNGQEDTKEETIEEESPVKILELNITCTGLYQNIQGVIRQITELDNIVIVKSVALTKDGTSKNLILATLTLEYPYYPDNSHYELEEWNNLPLKDETTDPFEYYIRGSLLDPNIDRTGTTPTNLSTILGNLTNKLEPTEVETSVDFFISARPKSSDDFAYTIGKKGDARNKIHSDLSIEELELYFEDVDGKPAFNMGTILRPVAENGSSEVFTPLSSKINIEVISQPRLNDADINSAVLRVTNKSSREVVVTIRNDDKTMPRITVVKEGKVTIK